MLFARMCSFATRDPFGLVDSLNWKRIGGRGANELANAWAMHTCADAAAAEA